MASLAATVGSTSLISQFNYGLVSNVCYNPYNGPTTSPGPFNGEYYEFDFQAPTTVTRYTFTNSTNGGGLQQEYWYNGYQFGASFPNNFLTVFSDLGTGANYSTTSSLQSTYGTVHMFGWFYAQRTGNFTFTLNNYQGYANLWVGTQSSLLSLSTTSTTTVAMTQGSYYYLRILGFAYPNFNVLVQGPGLPVNGTTDLTGWVFPGRVNNMYASDAPGGWSIIGDQFGFNTFLISLGSVAGNANVLPGASYTYTIPSPQAVMKLRFVFTSTVASNVLSVPAINPATSVGSLTTSVGGVYIGPTSMSSSGKVYSGEWIQMQLPTSIPVAEYMFLMDSNPVAWALHYSTDGTNWSLADSVSNSFTSVTEVHRFISATGSYWRFQVLETSPNSQVQGSFSLQRFLLFDALGRPVHSIQVNTNSYTTASNEQIGDAILGTYSVQSSTGDFTQPLAGTSTNFSSSFGPFGNYIGTTVTSNLVTSPNIIYGDWVQLSLPSAKQVANVAYRSQDLTATPSNVWILASNDLVAWAVANVSTVLAGHAQGQTFIVNTPIAGTYRHWRMIVSNVSPYYWTGSQPGFNLSAWYLLGTRGQVLNTSLVGAGSGDGTKVMFQTSYGGIYNGTTTTTVTTPATTIAGEWLELDLPSAVVSNVVYNNSYLPGTVVSILGTNTFNASWVLLSNINLLQTGYISFPNSTPYQYYRAIFAVAVGTSIGLSQISFCNSKGEPLNQILTANLTNYQTTLPYGTGVLGQYNFSSSKQGTLTSQGANITDDAQLAFNHNLTSWVSQRVFPGMANVSIEFQMPVVVTELLLNRPMFSTFSLLGSNDWFNYSTLINSATVAPVIDGQQQIFTFPVTSPGAYRIYQLNITQSLYGSNTVSVDDIGLYDTQGRINESCTSAHQNISVSQNFGGNVYPNQDYISVTFPSAVFANSYSIYSPSMPRAWQLYGTTTSTLKNQLLHTVNDYQYTLAFSNFPITNNLASYTTFTIYFSATQSSNVVINRLNIYNQYGFQMLPTTFTGPSLTIT